MSLASGTWLGPYEILAPIGAGGMGEVYRARDSRLGREVAIKVLPAEFSADPDRLHRFEQEARAIAALNHPHICQIHDGALAAIGERARAHELLREMGDAPLPVWGRVEYHLLCSEIDAAADWYEKMIEVRDPFAVVYAAAPIGRALRQSAPWPRLASMMNLPES